MTLSFPKSRRITHVSDFTRAFKVGQCVADGTLVINGLVRLPRSNDKPVTNDLPQPRGVNASSTTLETRLGLSIGKVVGNSPTRNHWKRLIREAFRQNHSRLPTGLDLVIRPKKGARPDFHAIVTSLQKLASRLDRKLRPTDG